MTPTYLNRNIGKQKIRLCIEKDTILWPRYRWSYLASDAVKYVVERIGVYVNVEFEIVESNVPSCELKYYFVEYVGRSVGEYSPSENTIRIQTAAGLSIWEMYKVIMHETLHAMGLDHNTASNDSIMIKALNDRTRQLIYVRDVLGLQKIWKRNVATFNGKSLDWLDYYHTEMKSDVLRRNSKTFNVVANESDVVCNFKVF